MVVLKAIEFRPDFDAEAWPMALIRSGGRLNYAA